MSLVQFAIAEDPPNRLDKALFRDAPEQEDLSRTRLGKLIEEGAVRVDGKIATSPKTKVMAGAMIEITLKEARQIATVAENIPLEVVYEDADLIVVNKPAGMVVHPAPGTPSGTLVNALLYHCADTLSGIGGERRPGIVHRIDKDTSGLLVVAKTDKAHHHLADQFATHSVERLYQALCFGVPEASDPRLRGVRGVNFEPGNVMKITTQLARHKTDRQRQAVLFEGGRHAVTRVRVAQRFGTPAAAARIECWLETGRTHQIRVHLAHTGHGLIGDPVYGGKRRIARKVMGEHAGEAIRNFTRQALHASILGFVHPVSGENLRFEAPLPEDFSDLLSTLKNTSA